MPYFVITLGNGYQYQLWANSQQEAVQMARARRPDGVLVGGTDLAAATADSVGNTPQPGVPDLNRNYPGAPGFEPPGGGVLRSAGARRLAAPGGDGGNFTGVDDGGLGSELENESPFAAYQRGLQLSGRPSGVSTTAGRYAREQYNPFLQTYGAAKLFGGGVDETPFEEYTRTRNIGDVRRQAADLLSQARGQPNFGDINLSDPDPELGQDTRINQLAMTALGSKISPLVQRMFGIGRNQASFRDDFLADREQSVGQNYIDYVRQRLGLNLVGL